MCRAVEELIDDEKCEIIVQLIKEGTLTLGKIAKVCNVSIEYVEKVKATMNGAA